MATTHEDLSLRLDRLEHDVRALSSAVARPVGRATVNDLSFRGWLKISGPTLAVMAFGFGLLWSGQQAHSAQLLEVSRTMGRLEGAITGLDARLESLDRRFDQFDARLGQLDARLEQLDARIDKLGTAVDNLADRVGPDPS